ncbi:MAG: hypothetical protein AB8U25_07570 [Rickettsiales endosymbiont of Dermacentor nuttalli]
MFHIPIHDYDAVTIAESSSQQKMVVNTGSAIGLVLKDLIVAQVSQHLPIPIIIGDNV